MKIRCRLEMNYGEHAELIYRSVKVDDERFVESFLDKNKLVAEISSSSPGSLLHTLNDYLSCLSIAEKILDKD